jgi:threonine/homoserine/homoserine lactone efflux protein
MALLPQFSLATPRPTPTLSNCGRVKAVYLAWFMRYVPVVDSLGRRLRKSRVEAGIDRVAGVLLITLAAALANT